MEHSNLLTFKINLNRDGDLEFNLECVNTMDMEAVLRKLGDPTYGPKIGSVVRHYFRHLNDKIKEERGS
jgi:hypothetical protein